jgi:hypothetical protein
VVGLLLEHAGGRLADDVLLILSEPEPSRIRSRKTLLSG